MAERQLTSEYVLLGLLASRDWSAYELAEQVGRGVDQVWPRAVRQRYNTLKRLVVEGWVQTRTESTGNRERTIYTITDSGRQALSSWLGSELHASSLEFEGIVRVLAADQGTVEQLRANLRQIVDQAQAALDLFVSHASALSNNGGTFPERVHLFAMGNRFMIGHYSNIIEWGNWALEESADWTDTEVATKEFERTLAMLRPALDLLPPQR